MTVIILLAAVGLVLSRLFLATFRVIDRAPKARDEVVRVQAMIEQLRDDVWRARDVRVDGPKLLVVDGITWTIDRDVIRRKTNDETGQFKPISAELLFVASTAGVTLQNAHPLGDADDSIVMASHAKLLAVNNGGGR